MAKPPKPTVPAPPLRSAPSTFSALAEAFLNFFPTFATYLDEVGDYTSLQADNALAAALGGTLPSPTGHAGEFIRVKPDETGVEFASVYATTATAAGTTTLTVNSSDGQFFTGATTQTVVLPVVSTLVLGRRFEITNKSTGAITVNSSGGNLVGTVPANTVMSFTCILLTGTTAASWDAKTEGFDITPALIRAQLGLAIGTDVQAYDADLVALAGIAGVEGDLIYRNASQWTKLAKGAAGRVLTQNAGLTAPEWAIPKSIDLLGTLNATSGSAQTLSGLNLTEYKLLFIAWLNVSGTGAANLVYKTLTLSALGGGTSAHSGHMWIDLSLGVAVSHSVNFSASPQAVSVTPLAIVGATVNADTSVSFSLSAGTFDSGTFEIYGVK